MQPTTWACWIPDHGRADRPERRPAPKSAIARAPRTSQPHRPSQGANLQTAPPLVSVDSGTGAVFFAGLLRSGIGNGKRFRTNAQALTANADRTFQARTSLGEPR